MKTSSQFSKNRPDPLAEQIAELLSETAPLAFNALFEKLRAALASRGLRSDGDMLRLRAHERLQMFLRAGMVTKNGKEYAGVHAALLNFLQTNTEKKAQLETIKQKRMTPQSAQSEAVDMRRITQRTKRPARKLG